MKAVMLTNYHMETMPRCLSLRMRVISGLFLSGLNKATTTEILIKVPLDYAYPEVGSATLAVARMRAFKYPQLGTIFTNPGMQSPRVVEERIIDRETGGPGNSGLQFLIGRAGKVISTITDGRYDIVSACNGFSSYHIMFISSKFQVGIHEEWDRAGMLVTRLLPRRTRLHAITQPPNFLRIYVDGHL